MLQRIQSVYLFVAIVVVAVTCFLPLATVTLPSSPTVATVHSVSLTTAEGAVLSYCPLVLLFLALLSAVLLVGALCSYTRRRRQGTLCTYSVALLGLWIVVLVLLCAYYQQSFALPHVLPAAGGPLVALLLTLLARRAIKKDEALVRAADRLR